MNFISTTTVVCLIFVVISPLRIRILEVFFQGLPSLYRWHHRLSWVLLFAIICHASISMKPFLQLTSTWREWLSLFFDPQDQVTFTGIIALTLFLLVQGFSYLSNLHRILWLWLHRMGVLGLIAAIIHINLASPWSWHLTSPDGLTRLIPHALLTITLILLMIHWIAPERLSRHFKFCVSSANHLRSNIVELNLMLSSQPSPWKPGTFGFFRFDCLGPCGVSQERHPFTVVSGENQNLKIIVKAVGDDTTHLQHIVPGTYGEVSGPYGSFIKLAALDAPQLWLAGGIGVVPFWGLLQNPDWKNRATKNVILISQNRKNSQPLFREEMHQYAKDYPWFHFIPIDDEPGSELTWERLIEFVPDWQTRIVALAGPQPMIKLWRFRFREKKIKRTSIFTEEFIPS